ncbi:hypothetical protein DERF_014991 [Dermatophagoides farinae]|uniref:Uncharacterized protein n=1 Tax=Dermatophagoides farinae TaxID=6954 RepID=A0A922HNI4_DERFA|nr:hypothetical protein DERF_014991 [Dermatophagoides farinae]
MNDAHGGFFVVHSINRKELWPFIAFSKTKKKHSNFNATVMMSCCCVDDDDDDEWRHFRRHYLIISWLWFVLFDIT